MRIGKVVMVVLMLLSFSSLALPSQEKLELLEEKLLKGEISEAEFKKLEEEYSEGKTPEASATAKLIPGKDYLWLEAEDGESNLYPVSEPSASGGKYQHMFGAKSIPEGDKYYYVDMPFVVEKDGFYRIYISTSPPLKKSRSTYEVCLDGEVIKTSPAGSLVSSRYGPKLQWVDYGKIELRNGKHTLTVRTNKRAVHYNQFCLDVDAAVLVPVNNDWKPVGTSKPTFVAKLGRTPYPWKPGMGNIILCEDVSKYQVCARGETRVKAIISGDNPQPNGKPSLLVKADFSRKAPVVVSMEEPIQIKSPGGRIVLWIDDNTVRPLDYRNKDRFKIGVVFSDANGEEIEVHFAKPLYLHEFSGEINPGWIRLEVPICKVEEEGKLQYPLFFCELRVYPYFWVDPTKGQHNEFYLGDLSVEMKGAYFRYFAYEKAEVSPDLVSTPLFFGMDCNFGQNTDYPEGVECVLELPESVRMVSWRARSAGLTDITDYCRMEREPLSRQGKKLNRFILSYPLTRSTTYADNSMGRKRIFYYLATDLKSGTVDAYYYLRIPGYDYSEEPQKLPLEVIRIKEVSPPRRLMTQMYVKPDWPGMIENLKRLGINRILMGGDADSEFIQKCKEAGLSVETYIAGWVILRNLLAGGAPGAVDPKGSVSKRIPCLSRAEAGVSGVVKQNKYLIDKGFTFFAFDDEQLGGIQCFCDKCLAGFEKFRKLHGQDLPDWEPSVFCARYKESNHGRVLNIEWWADTSNDDEAKKLYRLWQDYHHANYSKAAGLLKKGMQEYAAAKGVKNKIEFYDEWLQSTCSKYSARVAAQEAFDYISYYYYAANPKGCGDLIQTVAEWVNGSGAKAYWLLGAGLCYWRLQNFSPHKIMKWNVLETFAVGVDGVNMYDYAIIDLLDMKYYSEAIWVVLPVEDIVIEGKRAEKDVEIIEGKANLRALQKGNEYLILVSEYDHTDNRQVQVKVPDVLKGLPVWNLNERRQVGKISRRNNSFQAKLSPEERAVMYYVGEKRIGK